MKILYLLISCLSLKIVILPKSESSLINHEFPFVTVTLNRLIILKLLLFDQFNIIIRGKSLFIRKCLSGVKVVPP